MTNDPSKERVEHNLALKVMRLTRPTFGVPSIVQSSGDSLDLDILKNSLESDVNSSPGLPALLPGSLLVLPQSFGNIYLGETFTCYVCVHNDSTEVVQGVRLKADLQTASQRINLVPGQGEQDQQGSTSHSRDELSPGSTIDAVLYHEVKELGTHILVCEVTYSNSLSFRKFFKFQVLKPLDVKTKFYNCSESSQVFLEAQVQNITSGVLTLDRVTLEPSHTFTVESLVAGQGEEGGVVAKGECLQVGDAWQYLFCLTPRPEISSKILRQVTNIGKLDIVWRSLLCDRGRLQTSQLQRLTPSHGDLVITPLSNTPHIALRDHPVRVSLQLENCCDRTLEIDLTLDSKENKGVLTWTGITEAGLGLLEPGGTKQLTVECVIHSQGLTSISGINCTDTLLKRTYTFNDLCQVYIIQDEELYKFMMAETDK